MAVLKRLIVLNIVSTLDKKRDWPTITETNCILNPWTRQLHNDLSEANHNIGLLTVFGNKDGLRLETTFKLRK